MRIAVLADPLDNQNAGVHVYTKFLVGELLKRTSIHEIILIRQRKDERIRNAKQIIVPNINLPIGFASLRLFFIIPFILRKENVDVVIEPAHFGPFNLPSRIKRVTIIHDLTPILFPQHHRWHSQLLQKIFLKRILRKADLIITNSINTSRDLEQLYPLTHNKNVPIYLGKNPLFIPSKNESILKKYCIHKPYYLCVGTIEPRKNLKRLLDAYERVNTEMTDVPSLVIAGGIGWKAAGFIDKVSKHPFKEKIKLLGYVDDESLPPLYSLSEALIYPSLYEGFGFPVLEAMSCGSLVICSDLSSLPEVGGEVPVYVDPGNVDSLQEAMKSIINMPDEERKQRKSQGMEQAEKFTWEKFGKRFVEELDQLGSNE